MTESHDCSPLTVQPVQFEASVFGCPVWHLIAGSNVGMETISVTLDRIVERACALGVGLISCRTAPDQKAYIESLRNAQFRQIETLVTLRRPVEPVREGKHKIRIAGVNDVAACVQIGRLAFTSDRFHSDPEISNTIAGQIKEQWIANNINGRADLALVATKGAEVVGFNLLVSKPDEAVIDLIAVHPKFQGQGLGAALIESASARYIGRATSMSVGTQASNLASLALYRGSNFVKMSEQFTFHWTP